MTTKRPFSDYEPLKRIDRRAPVDSDPGFPAQPLGQSSSGERASDGDWASLGSKERLHSFQEETSENLRSDEESPDSKLLLVSIPAVKVDGLPKSDVREKLSENWILRNGHSMSFAGVVLFTVLVFFRPYELSTSLAWLSTSAFWVAIATVAILFPHKSDSKRRLPPRPVK